MPERRPSRAVMAGAAPWQAWDWRDGSVLSCWLWIRCAARSLTSTGVDEAQDPLGVSDGNRDGNDGTRRPRVAMNSCYSRAFCLSWPSITPEKRKAGSSALPLTTIFVMRWPAQT
jgi:hypothetical protein